MEKNFTIKKVDNSKLLRILGSYNFIDLEAGIGLTVRQYLNNQNRE